MSGESSIDRIHASYVAVEERYIAANPASRIAHETATTSLPGGNTRSILHWAPYPLYITSADGYTLHDADGHDYVDLLGEFSAGIYGHSHPVIISAITSTLQRGISYGGPHAAEARLARLVQERFASIEQLRFTNSGTEATMMAVGAAKAFTKKPRGKILVFEGAYHGGVFFFPPGCRDAWRQESGDARESGGEHDGLVALNAPHNYLVATYNDVAAVDALIESAARPGGGNDIAAILLEPMLGSGGGICATVEFLAHLRRRATEIGALLIFDEVMTSRMYDGGGIQGEVGVRPDLTTLGKYIGGGMSFGAFGGRREVMALFDPREPKSLRHAGTFNNNVLTMNVGAVGLEKIFTVTKARELHTLGDEIRDRINGLGSKMKVLGCGSILAFHFTDVELECIRSPADWKDEDPRLLDIFHLEMLNQGFYLARRGYAALNLMLLEENGRKELDRFVEAVKKFVVDFKDLL
ncbi:class III aminotransferase [Xylariaceae sp. FL1019]|nr:class III aminotransferase [Xylariaceae sp. FL1019]